MKPFNSHKRTGRGASAAEFAASLVVLVMFFVIPFLDLGVIPVRWGLANHLVTSFSVNLARAETLSRAFQQLNEDPNIANMMMKIGGVTPKKLKLSLLITKSSSPDKKLVVTEPKKIPAKWLPDSPEGPFQYELELAANCEISPLILINLGGQKITGLNAPFTINLISSSHWENLGRNPNTNEYYMNE